MKRRQSEDCLSDLQLDRWLSGELAESEQPPLDAHVTRCSSCRQRRAELEEEQRRFAQAAPGLGASRQAEVSEPAPGLMPRHRSRQRGLWVTGAGALAAAAALLLLVTRPEQPMSPGADGLSHGTRTKGGIASLGWIVRRGSQRWSLKKESP